MSTPRHATTTRRAGRKRLLIVLVAPLVALVGMTANAATGWGYAWSPPLDLTVHDGTANYVSLPQSMASLAGQKVVSTARFRTNWVDVRALKDGPNIAQQGLSVKPPQFKLQIAHGPNLVAAVFDEHLIPHLNLVLERVVRRHGRKHSRREIDRPGQRH